MRDLELAVIDVKPGAALESQSGLQMLRPRIHGAWGESAGPGRAPATLPIECVLQERGAGVQYLRSRAYEKVVPIGNSGGAALASFYQAGAEHLDIDRMADERLADATAEWVLDL